MAAINYAASYQKELANAYPYTTYFGALYSADSTGKYRWTDGKTIYIPNLTTSGMVDADRDTIGVATRNYDNSWEPKTLKHQRKWSTLVHPMDIVQTNMVASIVNITQTFNEEQKFPEMDAYCVSELYKQFTDGGKTADTTELTTANVLSVVDELMLKMDEERVPASGRILYCTNQVNTLLKQAQSIGRSYSVQEKKTAITRTISRIEETEIVPVPSSLMKSAYTFGTGFTPAAGAKQVNMLLVHPSAVVCPVSYQFSQLDPPSAGSEGKYIYYEEVFWDVFILSKKIGGVQFNIAGE